MRGFPVNGFGTSIVYVLAGHSGVYVGKARLDRKRMCGMGPKALEHLRTLLYTKCSGWDEAEIPDLASVSWVCVHVACDVV